MKRLKYALFLEEAGLWKKTKRAGKMKKFIKKLSTKFERRTFKAKTKSWLDEF